MKKFISIFSCFMLFLSSCEEEDLNAPYGSKETPEQVTVKEVVNKAGKATIFYKIPKDVALSYIKAVYTPRKESTIEKFASAFTDSLVVEGFEKEGEQIVNLYSVSYGGTESEPVTVTVSPQRPPYLVVFDNLTIEEAAEGFDVKSSNPEKATLTILVYKRGEDGALKEIEEETTEKEEIVLKVTGQGSNQMEISVAVADKWGNTSDYKTATITPGQPQ